jgi:membrane protein
MPDRDPPDRDERRFALDIEPTIAGRVAHWLELTRALRTRVEAARARHGAVDVGFAVVERDSAIGGGLLAGALAYRLFVLLLPTALLLVSGLGLYADAADQPPSKVAKEAGLHGLIASQVASSASSGARWIVS